jgi:hypothetical protein
MNGCSIITRDVIASPDRGKAISRYMGLAVEEAYLFKRRLLTSTERKGGVIIAPLLLAMT